MAEENDDSQKTEDPTPKRLQEAREKGDVPKSQELNSWFSFFALLVVTSFFTTWIVSGIGDALTIFVERPDMVRVDAGHFGEVITDVMLQVGLLLAVPMLLVVLFAVGSGLIQHGWLISYESLTPKWSKVSLLQGFKRLFSMQSVLNLVKGIVKLLVVGLAIGMVLWPKRSSIPQLAGLDLHQVLALMLDWIIIILIAVVSVTAVIAVLDLLYQRYQHNKKLRMTKQEVKDEMKQSEGDPMVKGRLRQLRMEKARQRMMASVPNADVVITNPTHYAVALEYDGGSMEAPKLTAKGVDAVALRIRQVAEENNVTVMENPPLARALYAGVEIDQEIPPEHYQAVAEVISYVMRLKGQLHKLR